MMRRAALVALVLLVASLFAGCGSGGEVFLDEGDKDDEPPAADVRLDTDAAGAALSTSARIAASDRRLYVVWADRRNGELDIYFNRSTDEGRSWLAEDLRLDTDRAGSYASHAPQVVAAGLDVVVVWYDERNGFTDVYLNHSQDGGLTWLAQDRRVNQGGLAAESRAPQVCRVGDTLVVGWRDRRDGGWRIYANRSLDGGNSWLAADVPVSREAGGSALRAPVLACTSNAFHLIWEDSRHGGTDIVASRSLNQGASWSVADLRLSALSTATRPHVAASGDHVHVLWEDARHGMLDIYARSSTDGGATWSSATRLNTNAAGTSRNQSIHAAAQADGVFVAWEDNRAGHEDVRFQRSLDGGSTWLGADLALQTTAPGASRSLQPRVAVDGTGVGVVWFDDRDGRMDVRLTWSPNLGSSWLTQDIRFDDDVPGAGHSIWPDLVAVGDRIHVVWEDQRSGPGDIYARGADFSTLR